MYAQRLTLIFSAHFRLIITIVLENYGCSIRSIVRTTVYEVYQNGHRGPLYSLLRPVPPIFAQQAAYNLILDTHWLWCVSNTSTIRVPSGC